MKASYLLTLLMVSVIISSCSESNKDANQTAANPMVNIQTISISELPEDFVFTGNIEGARRVNLSTKIMGTIISMPVSEGTQVSAGQTVVKIKSDDISAKRSQIKANLLEAEAALKNVEINYNRIKSLYQFQSATQKEMDDIEMAYTMAKARVSAVEGMEKEVTDIIGSGEVMSPIQGFVVKKMAQEGDMAIPGMPLLVVEDLSTLKINTHVPETEVHLFKKGDSVKIRIDALPKTTLTGIVDEINPGGNPASRQFEVKILLADIKNEYRSSIKSGMYAQVILEKGFTKSIFIPENVLVKRGQLEGVFVMSDHNTVILRWIKTGQRNDDQIEILSGLRDGEKIVVSSNTQLSDGHKVEVAL